MPLVFLVVFIMYLIVSNHDSNKENTRKELNASVGMRKTNARLEFLTTRKYYDQTNDIDSAIKSGISEMISLGYYSPCIPKDYYKIKDNKLCDMFSDGFEKCDSELVNSLKWQLWRHHGYHRDYSYEEEDEYVYSIKWPTSYLEYYDLIKRITFDTEYWIKPGKYVHSPVYGTCEIIKNEIYEDGFHGHYLCKKMSNGDLIKIPMNKKLFTRL